MLADPTVEVETTGGLAGTVLVAVTLEGTPLAEAGVAKISTVVEAAVEAMAVMVEDTGLEQTVLGIRCIITLLLAYVFDNKF